MTRKTKMFLQRICGLIMLGITALIIYMGVTTVDPIDKDITACLITFPFGMWMTFTKHYIMAF